MSACIRTVNKSGSFTGFLAKNQQTKYNWRMRPLGLSIPSMVHWIMCMAFRFSQSILRFAWTKSYNSVWHSIQQWISCIPRAKDKAPIWMASQLTPPKPKKWVFKEFLFLFFYIFDFESNHFGICWHDAAANSWAKQCAFSIHCTRERHIFVMIVSKPYTNSVLHAVGELTIRYDN